MKKATFKQIQLLLLLLLVTVSCSTDDATTSSGERNLKNNDVATAATQQGSYWDGPIAEEKNGHYTFTVDTLLIKNDLEVVLNDMGFQTSIQELAIVDKIATNDSLNTIPFLIGKDNNGVTIARMLEKVNYNLQVQRNDLGMMVNITCTGCIDGCNIDYLNINGKSVPYCNENGCSRYDCSETRSDSK